MPYKVVKSGSTYKVKDPKGKTYGTHKSKSKAQAQVRALYANTKHKK